MNLYWAVQHFDTLAAIREEQGLPGIATSARFLIKAHENASADRGDDAKPESKVRAAARQVMKRKSTATDESSTR
jgi:hypothetical protein